MNEMKEKLLAFGKEIYLAEDFDFSSRLLMVLEDLQLMGNPLAAGFFMSADTSNEIVRNKIIDGFGQETIEQVELLQRIGRVSFPETKKQILNLRKMFVELTDDLTIIFVKLAEKLLRLKQSASEGSADIKLLASECLYLYSPIAHRLGIRKIYMEMEDIAFRILFPAEFNKLNRQIEKKRLGFESKLKNMSLVLKKILEKDKIDVQVQSRVKRPWSIYLKLMNKGVTLDEIYDLMALRVITGSVEECYLALGIVHRNWIPIEGRFRDWVSFPKPNGYRSIQTTIISRSGDKFEIQIRTADMHREAEYGSAAHWAYKEGISAKDTWILRLKEFLENDAYFDNPEELLDMLKSDFKRDIIHVLTPMGDIKSLPKGATVVDFAYAVHTEVGAKCTGARVNSKFVKLKTELKSGDVVEIITQNNAKPSRDWLDFVKSSKARSKILLWIKKHEEAAIIAEGKRRWERLKKRYRKRLEGIDDELAFKRNLPSVGYKSPDDFYMAISINSLKPGRATLRKLFPEVFRGAPEKSASSQAKADGIPEEPNIIVEGLKNIKTSLAKCCHPIKGQPIVAYVTTHGVIKVHSAKCKYVNSGELDGERFKKAEWSGEESKQLVHMKIFGFDYGDMLKVFVDIADHEEIKVHSADKSVRRDKKACIDATIEVKDVRHLNKFTDKLLKAAPIDRLKVL